MLAWFLAAGGLLAVLGLAALAQAAPFVSPGNGQTYTMNTLEAAAGGQVSQLPAPPGCHYRIADQVIISDLDSLTIDANCKIEFDNNRNLTIRGRLIVSGTTLLPVTFTSYALTPTPGIYRGVDISGAGFAPSLINNATVYWATYGVRCSGCRDLAVHGLTAVNLSTDALLVTEGAANISAENISLSVSTVTGQNVVFVSGATNVTGRNVTGSGPSTLITVWNSSWIGFKGPIQGSGIVRFALWIDNATNVSVGGLAGATYPAAALVTRSASVVLQDAALTATVFTGMTFRSCVDLHLLNVTLVGAFGTAVLMDNLSSSSIDRANFSSSQSGLIVANSTGFSLTNVTAAALATALSVNRSTGVWINDSLFSGGATGIAESDSTGVVASNVAVETSATSLLAVGGEIDLAGALLLNGSVAGIDARSNALVATDGGRVAGAANASAYASVRAEDAAVVVLVDTTAANASMVASGGGLIRVLWSLSVGVRAEGLPVAGIDVSIVNVSGVLVGSPTTDSSGVSAAGALPEFELSATGRAPSSPYRVNASNATGFGGSATVGLTEPTVVWIDIVDADPPHLQPRPSPQRIARNETFYDAISAMDTDNVGIVNATWSFQDEAGVWVNRSGPSFSHAFSAPGRFAVTLRAVDAVGNVGTTVFVVWVNALPVLLNPPLPGDLAGFVAAPLTWIIQPSDGDPEDVANLFLSVSGEPGMTVVGFTFRWIPAAEGSYSFNLSISDGLDRVNYTLLVLVLRETVGNHPPVFESPPRGDANTSAPYVYEVRVSDPDAGDFVLIQLASGPQGMSFANFTQSPGVTLGQLVWDAGALFPGVPQGFNISFTVSLVAWDAHVLVYQNFSVLLRNPPDSPPHILPIDDVALEPGTSMPIDLRLYGVDADDDIETLTWSFLLPTDRSGFNVLWDTRDPSNKTLLIVAPVSARDGASVAITLVVNDSSGLAGQVVFTARVASRAPAGAGIAWPLWLLPVVGLFAVAVVAWRRRGRRSTGAPAAPPGPAGLPMYIEGAALFDSAHNLVASATVPEVDLDNVLVMLPSHLRTHPAKEGELLQLSLEGKDVALLSKRDGVIAALGLFAGDVSPWLKEPMTDAIDQVLGRVAERRAAGMEAVEADPVIKEVLRQLLSVSAGSSAEAVELYRSSQALHVASLVDLVQGYARLKVAVENKGHEIAADVRLTLDYDDKILRLERVEPEMDFRRDRLHIGNLRPAERKTIALYFDPQICTRSFINATVAYEDAGGHFQTTAMRTRPVEVVCPAFSTPYEANTAMLRRLLQEELAFHDSKFFRFDDAIPPAHIFDLCKRAVRSLDVKVVREHIKDRPYQAEAWFYGETMVSKARFVIWAIVFGKERVAQFSASSNVLASITGLLAELGRRFVEGGVGERGSHGIDALDKSEARAEVGALPTLFSSVLSIGPEEDQD